MKALVVLDKENIQVQSMDIPSCKENEVLIRVTACGICGSDIPRALDGKVHFYPIVLGHEFSGRVVQTGPNTQSIQVGDRVTAAPLLPCGSCKYCQMGKPAMCKQYNFLGSRKNGAMAEYVVVPEKNVLKLPDEVDDFAGAMVEPLTVALHGIERVRLPAGASVAVFGAGTIGLLTLQCLKARGVGQVTVIDIQNEKLRLARKLGADKIVNPNETDLLTYFRERPPQAVFETAGTPITQKQSIEIVANLGKVVYIGTVEKPVDFPPEVFERILRGELEITGSWMSYSAPYPGYEWETAIWYLKEGKVKVRDMITHQFRLKDGIKAFQTMRNTEIESVKVMFDLRHVD